MKKFSKIFALAICLAAFFNSCIKEEPFEIKTAYLDVSIDTRSASSSQQGDKIEDVMVWVFDTANNNFNLVGWRTYTPPPGTYTSLSLHIPVATCNGNASTYRVVAVLNKNSWGGVVDAQGKTLTLGPSTTYAELTSARFANAALINEVIAESNPGNPAVMPVSHWCDVSINKNDNTHTINETTQKYNCASADLSVYRAVAKTQLFMSKANDDFTLEVTGASIHSASVPSQGVLLSEDATKVDWFGEVAPASSTSVISLKNDKDTDKNAIFVKKTVDAVTSGTTYNGEFVASTFLYENPVASSVPNDYADYEYTTTPTGNGYYMRIDFKVDGDEKYACVPFPAVVRNHDYQVKATVDAGGSMVLTLAVNDWDKVPEFHDYSNEVSVPEGGDINWTTLPVDDKNSSDQIVEFSAAANVTAECEFYLNTPANGTWRAELVTIEGKEGAFAFENGTQVTTGVIAGSDSKAVLKIKTTGENVNGISLNKAKLRITASKKIGDVVRTYNVDLTEYTLVQSI
ncbi:MAG: hypothetical protein IKU88_06450 [Alistipes sp.]|nr:hypothetical protein [Alistipes sp.]